MITILKPTLEDVEGLYNVIKKSWYATYVNETVGVTKEDVDAIYGDDDIHQKLQAIRNRIEHPKDTEISFVAKNAHEVVGQIRLVQHDDHIELRTLYILPEHTGQGIGKLLWEKGLSVLDNHKPITVDVASYTRAKDFYTKIGFQDTGERYISENTKMPISGVQIHLMKMIFNR